MRDEFQSAESLLGDKQLFSQGLSQSSEEIQYIRFFTGLREKCPALKEPCTTAIEQNMEERQVHVCMPPPSSLCSIEPLKIPMN